MSQLRKVGGWLRRLPAAMIGKSRRRRWALVATTTALVAVMGFFVAAALGVLAGSPSKFESGDGNMVVDTTGNNDWNSVTNKTAYDHKADTAHSGSDDSFVSGQKQDSVCPDVAGHQNPPKDDFTDVASFSETNTDSNSAQFLHTFLYGATIRFAANGNASENVELNKGTSGNCIANDPTSLLKRTPGDKLIAIDYLNGGTNVQFHVLTWIDGTDPSNNTCFVSNDPTPCWGSQVQNLAANAAEGLASQSDIAAADNKISNTDLVAGQFAEFGVDLTAAGIIPKPTAGTPCTAFPQTIWESRASGSSFVSTTKDITIEKHTISNCGEIKIIKHTDPRGIDKKFSYTSNLLQNANAGGVACTSGGSAGVDSNGNFCLNDSGGTANSDPAGNHVDESNLSPGTYTVTEGALPSGFDFEDLTCSGGTTTIDKPNRKVTVQLAINDVVTCTFVNRQQAGAIKITKTSTKGNTALAGAHFQVCTNNGPYDAQNPCAPAKSGSDDLVTGSDGTKCIDNLGFGDYYVTEKSAPSGYKIDDSTTSKVTVDNNAGCADTTYVGESKSYTDTPLSTIEVKFTSLAKDSANNDVTSSQIVCKKSSAVVAANSENGSADNETTPVRDDTDEVFGDGTSTLTPGVYTCTVDIDP